MARRWRNSVLVLAALAGVLGGAMPAEAQMYSTGFQFLKAVKDGDGDKLAELIQKNSTTIVNAQDLTSGEGALHILVRKHTTASLTWMRYLIQQGANVNIADKGGVTPLALAVQLNNIEAVQALIDGRARVDTPNSTGETPLITAVHGRDIPLMRMLLKGGANPDRADSSGRSARDYARLDGVSSSLLSEIEKNEKPKAQREGAKTYGPSF
ncbi:MAG: ankyrin repeat domain-containing protein [Candidatus Andeanibacterium colombiense]|uniref:Ankyrin repeat domain-containing protein n=1 Tax=Candidatus Andeanibacterium colombiense TaxID=3121345 RepID=A0AAJ5X4R0_9SPHN|nr:MAG: ankyrin repeat domain-containing protein [Sphingomonadaceae bacterium]